MLYLSRLLSKRFIPRALSKGLHLAYNKHGGPGTGYASLPTDITKLSRG